MSEGPNNVLYEIPMKVWRGEGCDLPEGMEGALVSCYAAASDWQSAAKKGVAAVTAMHYVFDDIPGGRVSEIPAASWSAYITKRWPEFAEHFPSDDELRAIIESAGIFFGPFAAFTRS